MLELDYDQLIQVYKHNVKGDTYVSRCELHKGNKGSKKMKGNCRLVYCFNPI